MYIDFECLLLNISDISEKYVKTIKKNIHTQYGFIIYLVSRVNKEQFQTITYTILSVHEKCTQELVKIKELNISNEYGR